MKITKKEIFTYTITLGLVFLIACSIISSMVSSTCIKSEDKYFRFQERGGIFGGIDKVLTTKNKADGIMKSCMETLKSDGFFNIRSNTERLAYAFSGKVEEKE